MPPLYVILLLWLGFIGGHLVMSHPPVRAPLRAALGPNGFAGVYSLMALGFFIPLVIVWWTHRHQGPMLWMLRGMPGLQRLVEITVVLGFGLEVAGLMRPAPGSMSYSLSGRKPEVLGINTVTRHPLFVGASLWAVAHLVMNGWATDVAFFAGFPVMTALGCMHQDWRKVKEDPDFQQIIDRTSIIPFAAVLRGHRVRLDRMSWVGLGLGGGMAILLRVFHARLFA